MEIEFQELICEEKCKCVSVSVRRSGVVICRADLFCIGNVVYPGLVVADVQ